MMARILKTLYAVGGMARGMAGQMAAGVVGNGATADEAGKRIVWCMEVRSRAGGREKQAYEAL